MSLPVWVETQADDWCGEHPQFENWLNQEEESLAMAEQCPETWLDPHLSVVRACSRPKGHDGSHHF